jgi:uncharacterized membrane protein
MFRKAHLFAFALCGAFCLPAQADVIFSNITGTFSTANEATVCSTPDLGCPFGTAGGGYIYQAAAFTPPSNFTLSNVKVAVRGAECAGVPATCIHNSYNVALYSDSNGLPGGAITGASGALAPAAAAVQTLNLGSLTLKAGTRYWLVMTPGSGGTYTYWMGGGSASAPAAFISYNAFTGQNGGSGDLHQPPKWLSGGTSALQFEVDGVPASQHPSYTFTPLTCGGATFFANGINDSGTIVGSFVLKHGTCTAINVPFPGANNAGAYGINAQGDIVGTYISAEGRNRGFLLQGSVYTDLSFPGALFTSAYGINSRAEIIGIYSGLGPVGHGFIRQKDVFTTVDVPFPDARGTTPFGINDFGDIVGVYVGGDGIRHGFLKKGSAFTSFDVPFPGASNTTVSGINNRGEIVGTYYEDRQGSVGRGFIFANGKFTSFDATSAPPSLHPYTLPKGINDLGEIVGLSIVSNQESGFLAKP